MTAAAALCAAAALGLSACSSSGGGSSSSTGGGGGKGSTIHLVAADYGTGPSNTSQKYWQGIANDFQKANPTIKVDVKTVNWNDIDNQVKTMVQNHQYPDVLEGNYYSDYAQEGLLYPAKDVYSNLSNVVPAFKNADMYKGTQYGIPFTTSSRTQFYNKKLFQQAGISGPPQTWADVKNDALAIKQKTGKIGFGLPLGSEEAQAESLLWMLGNGGGYQDSSGNWTINSPQNVQTFDFLKDLVKSGATEPNPGNKNRTDLWKQFAQGAIGIINGSPALIPIIQQGKVLSDSDWASIPIPGKSGPLSTTLGVYDNVSAFKGGGASQAAIKKFLDFAYQDKYQVQFDKEYDLLPATTTALNALSSDPLLSPFLKALPNAVQYPISNTAWPQVLSQIQHTIGTAITGSPKSVLDQIQNTAKKGG
jgi:multiple sugar transport system substrate-binding protein